MASYKVAQDVEADDKLIGPFGFRQFIYLIVVAAAGFLGYGLWNLFPPLAVLPLPIILLFGALALPLRKDQPMETYLAAMVSFYLKPHNRLWKPDGVEHILEITAPKTVDESLTKGFNASEADRRLTYLADIADSRGWAIRHATSPGSSMISDVYNDAQATQDILDDNGNIAQTFGNLIDRANAAHRQEVINRIHAPQLSATVALPAMPAWQQTAMPATPASQQFSSPQQPPAQTYAIPAMPAQDLAPSQQPATSSVAYNPYPSIHQTVIQPMSAQPAPPQQQPRPATVAAPQRPQQPTPQRVTNPQSDEQSTSGTPVSPDIINLASNSKNLSVETIAHEAKKLHSKRKHDDGEVIISLR